MNHYSRQTASPCGYYLVLQLLKSCTVLAGIKLACQYVMCKSDRVGIKNFDKT